MYSRLRVGSKDRGLDLEDVQSYELASVPYCISRHGWVSEETNQEFSPEGQLKDGQTLILASQDGSELKVTKALNREDIPSSPTTRKQTVGCLCIVNISQTSYQTSAILPRGLSFFPQTQMWQFYVGIALANCPFTSLVPLRYWKKQKVHSSAQGVEKVGQDVCNLSPAMHALTGCDST